MFKFFKPKERFLITFELIYVSNEKGYKSIDSNDLYRFILDYATHNNICIKKISVKEPPAKSYIELKTKNDYVSFINFFLEPCNSKWTKLTNCTI